MQKKKVNRRNWKCNIASREMTIKSWTITIKNMLIAPNQMVLKRKLCEDKAEL